MQYNQTALWIAGFITATVMLPNISVEAQNNSSPDNLPMNIKVDCKNPQTQFQMNFCAAETAKTANRQLNRTYQKAIAKFKGTPQEKQLVDAQLVWIKFRDADCAFSRDRFQGGSMAPMVYSGCIARMSQQRIKELEGYLTEGGL
ncbi:MAG: lysozyme inhibitor LprI family protein [Plectolyngbya sp. WJT66-NPBG17]|jgi:uncharacterized protein YecT (DUF1311 family)|nr:lysozyme inhibitor LprI family protein [Plectolyngbya sp. WJT66-NPBG17]MBW4524718.1 lysozyme inhibitor LprI family protein [Phormidium tanganyikae FI6-MK23]